MMKVYSNIKARRKELGMTQQELADKAGYSGKSAISRIEKGDIDLPVNKLKDIAKALEITPEELLDIEDMSDDADIPSYIEGTSEIVDLYCRVTPEQRNAVLHLLRSFVE